MNKVDAIIVGQGLAGSCLSMTLRERGMKVHVFDPISHESGGSKNASRSAAGLFNPVTGRKMVKTWLADQLFRDLETYYRQLESELSIQCYHPMPMYRPFQTVEDQNDWVGADQDPEYRDYIERILTQPIGIPGIIDPYGGLMLKRTGYVDIPVLLDAVRLHLISDHSFTHSLFEENGLKYFEGKWQYTSEKDVFQADWVIYCSGLGSKASRYWKDLRFKPVKGEWLDLEMDLSSNLIINRGVFMIPRDGGFRVGATYDHSNLESNISEKGRKELTERMSKLYLGNYTIKGQHAGIRPATYDRRPFVGAHPTQKGLAILNGLGAKGVTLAPYFAQQMAAFLLEKRPIMKEVDCIR